MIQRHDDHEDVTLPGAIFEFVMLLVVAIVFIALCAVQP